MYLGPWLKLQLNYGPDEPDDPGTVLAWLEATRDLLDRLYEVAQVRRDQRLIYCHAQRDAWRFGRSSEKRWAKLRELLHARDIDQIALEYGGQDWLRVSLESWDPRGFSVAVRTDVLPEPWPEWLEPGLVDLACTGAASLPAITGYVTVDVTSYEHVMGINAIGNIQRFSSMMRGYYWGNILSAGHLERLGGCAALEDGPWTVRDLSDGECSLVYLQLDSPLSAIDDDQVRALRELFRPVLIGGIPGDFELPREEVADWGPLHIFEDGPVPDPAPEDVPAWARGESGDPVEIPGPTPEELEAWNEERDRLAAVEPVEVEIVETGDLHWEALELALVVDGALADDARAAFGALVDNWLAQAQRDQFGGPVHDLGGPAFVEEADTTSIELSIDLGAAEQVALDTLVDRLGRVCALHGLTARELRLGVPTPRDE